MSLSQAPRAFSRAWMRRYMPVEVYPLVGLMGIMVSGATFMLYRVSQASDVVWDRKTGDWAPWDKVKYDQNLKLYARDKSFWAKRHVEASAAEQERLRERAAWDQSMKEMLISEVQ